MFVTTSQGIRAPTCPGGRPRPESGAMRWYAERPDRRARQVLADALVLTWTIIWIWFATKAFDLVSQLPVPGRKRESGATSLAGSLADAGQRAGDVPLIGGALSAPLNAASQASNSVAGAGQDMQDAVRDVAWLLGLLVGGGVA